MIESLVIAVLLGTSVGSGEKPSCADVQRTILNILEMSTTITVLNPDGNVGLGTIQLRMGSVCPIQHSNFDTRMFIERMEYGNTGSGSKFAVWSQRSDHDLPTITVAGKQYKLYKLEVGPVAHEAAYLKADFIETSHTTLTTGVAISVPIILSEDYHDPGKNVPLSNELLMMKTITPRTQGWTKITWLETLLENAKRLTGHNAAFMTDCQTIWKNNSQWTGLLM